MKKADYCPSPSRQLLSGPLGCLGCRLVPRLASDDCVYICICPGLLAVSRMLVHGHVCPCSICMAVPFPLLPFRQWQLFRCSHCIGRHCFPLVFTLLPRLQAGCRCPIRRTCRRNSCASLLVLPDGHTTRQLPDRLLAPAGWTPKLLSQKCTAHQTDRQRGLGSRKRRSRPGPAAAAPTPPQRP